MNGKQLYDRHMVGEYLTDAELSILADWLQEQINLAILLGDGNKAEYYASILLSACKD